MVCTIWLLPFPQSAGREWTRGGDLMQGEPIGRLAGAGLVWKDAVNSLVSSPLEMWQQLLERIIRADRSYRIRVGTTIRYKEPELMRELDREERRLRQKWRGGRNTMRRRGRAGGGRETERGFSFPVSRGLKHYLRLSPSPCYQAWHIVPPLSQQPHGSLPLRHHHSLLEAKRGPCSSSSHPNHLLPELFQHSLTSFLWPCPLPTCKPHSTLPPASFSKTWSRISYFPASTF